MSGKYALVIGNSEYQDPNLTRLKAPEADVEGLSALLRDPLIGAFDDVLTLANELSATIRLAIAKFFGQKMPDDLLVLYFSGHGVLDENGELYLATKDTQRDVISGTAIKADFITGEMNRSKSKRQVLILDCCHSGAFARGSKGMVGASVGTASVFQGTGYGRVVLTATDATQFAWEGDQVIGTAENSLFTHYMIEGLQTGEADTDGDGQISVENLYDYVYEQVVRTTPKQTPGKWSYKQQGEIVIAKNPNSVTKPAELPRELREAINSPVAGAREGTVHELGRLLNGPDPRMALAALEALKQLADDDSRRVANAATGVLNAYAEAKRVQEQAGAEQAEAARVAREKAEQEQVAKAKAEADRVAREKAEQERIAKERAEAERLAREKAERERVAKERAEAERLAREKAERERVAREKAGAERVAAAPVAAPERKAVTAGTSPKRRSLFVLVAGIAMLFVCGIVAIVASLSVLAPKPPTPAPTITSIALATAVPTVVPTLVPTEPPASPVPPSKGSDEPTDASAYDNRGWIYFTKGDLKGALADFNQALSLDPKYADAYYGRGSVYKDTGDLERALADYNQVLSLDPKFANAYYTRGNIYEGKGDWDRALADYNQRVSLDPKNASAYFNRGWVYLQKGDLKGALADFNQALSLDPKYTDARYGRGSVYKDTGDLERALADYNQVLSLDPNYANAYYTRGLVYRQRGNKAQAIADFQTFLKLKPDASERANVEQWIQELKR